MIRLLAVLLISTATASTNWPTVVELESALLLHRGVELPKMIPSKQGAPFRAYYMGATSHADGTYTVEVLLRR